MIYVMGGGDNLNFEVVGGTTQPSNPKENTIWVNTSTDISSWSFSPTYPALQSKTRNLIVYPYYQTTKTENGVTFTVNSDGSITVNGTATAATYFRLSYTTRTQNLLRLKKGTYTLSGCPAGGSSTYRVEAIIYNADGSTYGVTNDGNSTGSTFELTADRNVRINIYITSGAKCSNLIFWPQLEKGSTKTSYIKGDAGGQVWIRTDNTSSHDFNALKKNDITIYPVAAKQYISGAWVDKTAKFYSSGEWCDWVIYIYKNGAFSQISGFTMTNGTASNSSNTLTFTSTNTTVDYMLARSTQKIDLTGMNKLSVHFLSGSKTFRASSLSANSYTGFGFTTATPTMGSTSDYPKITNTVAWRVFSHTENNNAQPSGSLTLDISSINTSAYLCFLGDPYDGSSSWKAVLKMDLIVLE